MQNTDETQPVTSEGGAQGEEETGIKPRRRIGRLVVLGITAILVLALLGGVGGYLTALQDRQRHEASIISTEVSDQFLLGLIEFERGQYELARQRFEYILHIDPGNGAAAQKLTETLLKLNESDALPTEAPTPTVTPTPDSRNQAELFQTAIDLRNTQNWDALLDTLDSLRLKDPTYNSVQVDGMYYLAYRNRGFHRIQVEGNLEGGIFDLNRAELFGILDAEARNFRDWAAKYITGLSFWGVDWNEVVNYFGPLAISAPYLSDSNFFTAQDRFATAQVEVYYEILVRARARYVGGKWCDAYDLFNQASAYIQLDAGDLEKFQTARDRCFGVEPTVEPEATPTPGDPGDGS